MTFRDLRNYLLKGVLITLPMGATLLLCWKVYEFLNHFFLNPIHKLFAWMGLPMFPLLDLLVFLSFLVLVGVIGGNLIGKKLVDLTHWTFRKIPLISVIYNTIQQIIETLFNNKHKRAFSQVALIEYPRKGMYSLGFVTGETQGVVSQALSEKSLSIFVPTTPNPTSGFLIFLPESEVKILNISVDQAAKLVMSAGVIDDTQKISGTKGVSKNGASQTPSSSGTPSVEDRGCERDAR